MASFFLYDKLAGAVILMQMILDLRSFPWLQEILMSR